MFRRKEAAGQAALVEPVCNLVNSSQAVREIGQMWVERLWPDTAEVRLASALPPLSYPPADFWRLMEALIGAALSACPRGESPMAVVGCNGDPRVPLFSVSSSDGAAFAGVWSEELDVARAIVERNGGRFWTDSRYGPGCTAFFTVPSAHRTSAARPPLS